MTMTPWEDAVSRRRWLQLCGAQVGAMQFANRNRSSQAAPRSNLQKRIDEAEALNLSLVKFLKTAVTYCWMGKPWSPQDIRKTGVELGLMVKKEECVYAYSDAIKKAHPNL